MRIDRRLGLVGSGALGFDLTDPFDCNVFLADAGGEHVLFDAGAGLGADAILAVCREDGVDPDRVRHLVLTHAHGDHGGGAAHLRDRLPGLVVHATTRTAEIVAAGDEDAVSMPAARRPAGASSRRRGRASWSAATRSSSAAAWRSSTSTIAPCRT